MKPARPESSVALPCAAYSAVDLGRSVIQLPPLYTRQKGVQGSERWVKSFLIWEFMNCLPVSYSHYYWLRRNVIRNSEMQSTVEGALTDVLCLPDEIRKTKCRAAIDPTSFLFLVLLLVGRNRDHSWIFKQLTDFRFFLSEDIGFKTEIRTFS